MKVCKRIEKYLESHASYIKPHSGMPKLFKKSEIIEMNEKRDKNNQLEAMPNGLLRFHCCYEDCPDYL